MGYDMGEQNQTSVQLVEEAAQKLRLACHAERSSNTDDSLDALARYAAALRLLATRLNDLAGSLFRSRVEEYARELRLRDDAGADPLTRIHAASLALHNFATATDVAHVQASVVHSALAHLYIDEEAPR